MALLTDRTGKSTGVCTRHLIGRSRQMHTSIDRAEVSAQHAVITWLGSLWAIRDLGSRNGTLVGGERIEAGIDVPLNLGDTVSFGSPENAWTLSSDEAPGPFATAGDDLAMGEGDVLALPTVDNPVALVHFDPAEGWVVAEEDASRSVKDGDTLTVAGRQWRLALPESLASTVELRGAALMLHDVALRFSVSADEEFVELAVQLPGGVTTLAPRAHHYPLLVLARRRLQDVSDGATPAEQGWVYTSDLQKMLRLSGNRINLGIFRARRELEALDIADAPGLVERRTTTHQVRLGVSAVTVTAL